MFIVDPFNNEAATNSDKINQMKKVMNGILNYSLTDRQRQVFEMYYRDNIKMPEIAEILGISKSSVYDSLNGARKKIKRRNTIVK
ncbi:MAG: sigma-70 family RNA polymerase sigma factor [Clostridiaceae bacterium]